MEDEGILDPLDNLHLIALHHVYLENIQEKLEIWSRAWSQHRIRTTKSLPIRMWIAGQLQNPVGTELGHNEIDCYGTEGFINYDDDVEDGSGRPIFDSLSFDALSDDCKQQLHSEIPTTWTSSNFGIDVYLKRALSIVKNSLGS